MNTTMKFELPAPGYPMVTRVISNVLRSDKSTVAGAHWAWVVKERHPIEPRCKVVRMFVDERGGVEVYSMTDDAQFGVRNIIPAHEIKLIEEGMPIDVFVEELAAAEMDGDEPDEPETPEETDVTTTPSVS